MIISFKPTKDGWRVYHDETLMKFEWNWQDSRNATEQDKENHRIMQDSDLKQQKNKQTIFHTNETLTLSFIKVNTNE